MHTQAGDMYHANKKEISLIVIFLRNRISLKLLNDSTSKRVWVAFWSFQISLKSSYRNFKGSLLFKQITFKILFFGSTIHTLHFKSLIFLISRKENFVKFVRVCRGRSRTKPAFFVVWLHTRLPINVLFANIDLGYLISCNKNRIWKWNG